MDQLKRIRKSIPGNPTGQGLFETVTSQNSRVTKPVSNRIIVIPPPAQN